MNDDFDTWLKDWIDSLDRAAKTRRAAGDPVGGSRLFEERRTIEAVRDRYRQFNVRPISGDLAALAADLRDGIWWTPISAGTEVDEEGVNALMVRAADAIDAVRQLDVSAVSGDQYVEVLKRERRNALGAADSLRTEIERLRQVEHALNSANDTLAEEVERLRANHHSYWKDLYYGKRAENERLQRERQQYRTLIRELWAVIGEMQFDGHKKGAPVPTGGIDQEHSDVLSDVLYEEVGDE